MNLGELLTLTPTDFEERIALLLRDIGFRSVERVGRSGDLGVDVRCRDKRGLVVVQCKRHGVGQNVGSSELQSFLGMATHRHHAKHGVFVTTSGYTPSALDAAFGCPITLLDGDGLLDLMEWVSEGNRMMTEPADVLEKFKVQV
ncbi:MAG: restriction endonuclease [Chloroflexota bacterium]